MIFHCMDIPYFFIRLSEDGHLGYFHILAIMNNGALNVCVQVFVWMYIFISLGYISYIYKE